MGMSSDRTARPPHRPALSRHMLWLLLALLGSVFPPAGCRRPASSLPVLRLYCGAGIRPPVAEMVKRFSQLHNIRMECDYAGSNILLSRIKLTHRGDLYMPGDVRYVEQARREGLIATSVTACYFVPVILVSRTTRYQIRSVDDLAQPGLRLGIGDPEACAIGKTAHRIFQKSGADVSSILSNVVFRSLTVNELGLQVKTGELDAVIVWDAIAHRYRDVARIVPIPPEHNVLSTVPVAVLRFSRYPKLATAFQRFVVSQEGKRIFRNHGYTVSMPK